ncbi:MAG: Sec-independent protein translocase subunit TatC [Gammaproteobacteria bacterium]|nr:MAG: Sec-independent protein translocase subunit TatC [Gammaproteobacteria bacterium]
MSASDHNSQKESDEGSLLSHLLELRDRLLYAFYGMLPVFAVAMFFSQELYTLLAKPLLSKLPLGATMIATEVASPFFTPLKLAFIVTIVVTIPWLLYQLWAFVAPGLYKHEKSLTWPLLVSSTVLFYCGMAFAYFVVFPLVFGFFTSVAPEGVQIMTDIRAYLDFVFSLFIAFGVAFEVPVAVVLLSHAGVVDPDKLAKQRPYVVLGAFVIAMVMTPPDVISQTLLAVPMLLLFEVGLFFARRLRKQTGADKDREMTDKEMERELDNVDTDMSDDH